MAVNASQSSRKLLVFAKLHQKQICTNFRLVSTPLRPTTHTSHLKNCSKLSIPANYQIKHWPQATRSWKHYKYYDKPERNFPSEQPTNCSPTILFIDSDFSTIQPFLSELPHSTLSVRVHNFNPFARPCMLHFTQRRKVWHPRKNENFAVFFSHGTLTRFAASCCANLRTMMVQFVFHFP